MLRADDQPEYLAWKLQREAKSLVRARIECIEQPVNTGTSSGKAFLDMLGVFAEFETNLRKERQLEGIAAAKARGVYTGRKPVLDPDKVRKLASDGMGGTAIAKRLGISRSSVYRLIVQ